jgi:uncharacterized protein (AIM24 family)
MAIDVAGAALEREFLGLLARGGEAAARGDLEPARAALEDALAIRSRDPVVLGLLGQVFYRLARYDDAGVAWQQLVDDNPVEPGARVNLGLAWLKARRYEEAIKQFRIALDLNPDHRKAAGYLGLAWLEVGQPAQAREWFVRAGSEQMVARCDQLAAEYFPPPPETGPEEPSSPAAPSPSVEPSQSADPSPSLVSSLFAESPPPAEAVEQADDRPVEVVDLVAVPEPSPAPVLVFNPIFEPVGEEPESPPEPGPELQPDTELAVEEPPSALADPPAEPAQDALAEPTAVMLQLVDEPPSQPPAAAPRPPDPSGLPTLTGFAAARALQGPAGQVFVAEGATLTVNVHGELLCRLAGLAAWRGELAFAGEVKRFRGRATDKPFGEPPEQMHRLVGDGLVVLRAAGRRFTVLDLGGEAGYFREAVVFGFQEPVAFENGRLPSPGGGLDLVHLRGRGGLVLVTRGEPVAVEVTQASPVHVPLASLIGWTGALTPRIAPLFAGGADGEAVEISGEGRVLVDPGPTVRSGDGP